MKYRFDGFNWLVRMDRGEKLVDSLTKLAIDEKLPSVWVSGLGGSTGAELGFYNLDTQQYEWKKLDQLLEITNIQGNLTWENDKPVWHLHGTFADQNLQALGGHIKELEVAATCEILLHKWYEGKLARTQDTSTGLNLLDL